MTICLCMEYVLHFVHIRFSCFTKIPQTKSSEKATSCCILTLLNLYECPCMSYTQHILTYIHLNVQTKVQLIPSSVTLGHVLGPYVGECSHLQLKIEL